MEGKDILNAILAHESINAAQLCQQIGLVGSKTQALYDTLRGKTQKVPVTEICLMKLSDQ